MRWTTSMPAWAALGVSAPRNGNQGKAVHLRAFALLESLRPTELESRQSKEIEATVSDAESPPLGIGIKAKPYYYSYIYLRRVSAHRNWNQGKARYRCVT